jgi:hypothetical protein
LFVLDKELLPFLQGVIRGFYDLIRGNLSFLFMLLGLNLISTASFIN